jgi:hypothetical protein
VSVGASSSKKRTCHTSPSDASEDENAQSSQSADEFEEEHAEDFNLQNLVEWHKNRKPLAKIPKPPGIGGRSFNIHDHIGLASDATWYIDILVGICAFSLVK